jgi:nucleoside-diphosphate-sugar epimerase
MKHDRQGFITTFLRRAIQGEPIRVFGDGSQVRDFTYVSDAVDAFLAVALTKEAYGGAFNVGGLRPVSLLEVAGLCQELAGGGENRVVEAVPWPPDRKRIDIGSVFVDHTSLSSTTGWEPTVDLREGLEHTIEFYKVHGDHYWS